jgi:hypothetical protein
MNRKGYGALVAPSDLYEYPPMIFEYQYLCNSLRKCGVIINDIDEYEDENGNLHLITDIGDFFICPEEFRASYNHAYLKWEAIISHTIKMLNDLLFQTGSDEKFYVLHEKSEEITVIVLLNSPLFNFFGDTKELENQCLPKPIEKYFENILLQF